MVLRINSLEELFLDQLKDLYSAENQLITLLPKMADAATSPELQRSFSLHLEQTKDQVRRIEQIFASRQESTRGRKCLAMEGLLEDCEEMIGMRTRFIAPEVLDAGLIAAAQKVEHFEIASYGTLRAYAETLGDEDAARLLQQTLDEEISTDQLLTGLAESQINVNAAI